MIEWVSEFIFVNIPVFQTYPTGSTILKMNDDDFSY